MERGKMKKLIVYALLALFCMTSSGCSVVMAARQPDKKNMKCLDIGAPRDNVLAELGKPIATEADAQKNKVDIFQFKQGFNTSTKTARALVHGVADVFTLGLWEVVGTPAEAFFGAKNMAIKVVYDENDKVKDVVYLKGK
jgi:hypothetical protein